MNKIAFELGYKLAEQKSPWKDPNFYADAAMYGIPAGLLGAIAGDYASQHVLQPNALSLLRDAPKDPNAALNYLVDQADRRRMIGAGLGAAAGEIPVAAYLRHKYF